MLIVDRFEVDQNGVQVILGHAAVVVTRVYAGREMAKGAEVARRIG